MHLREHTTQVQQTPTATPMHAIAPTCGPEHPAAPPAPLTVYVAQRAEEARTRLLCLRPRRPSTRRRQVVLTGRVIGRGDEARRRRWPYATSLPRRPLPTALLRSLARDSCADTPLLLVLEGASLRLVAPAPASVRETAALLAALEDLTPRPAAQ